MGKKRRLQIHDARGPVNEKILTIASQLYAQVYIGAARYVRQPEDAYSPAMRVVTNAKLFDESQVDGVLAVQRLMVLRPKHTHEMFGVLMRLSLLTLIQQDDRFEKFFVADGGAGYSLLVAVARTRIAFSDSSKSSLDPEYVDRLLLAANDHLSSGEPTLDLYLDSRGLFRAVADVVDLVRSPPPLPPLPTVH